MLVQAKFFSGIHHIMIHVVANGVVMPYLLDRNMETHLPVIPPEIEEVSVKTMLMENYETIIHV